MVSALAADLRAALDRDEVVPHAQPLVELRSGELSGFEVLARWDHAGRGAIPPTRFIPVAEKAGLIGALTERLLLRAGTAAAGWPAHLTLSVNVSPLQLREPGLAAMLRRAGERAGIAMRRLVFEITESAVVGNAELARRIAGELKALGAQLALDDFGTGYSCLRHLQALPFDRLKIDAGFVRSMVRNRESRKIVAAVIGLGHSLGLTTVAEGVEEEAQAELLVSLGCDLGQGWLFGRPVPVTDVELGLATGRWRRAAQRPRSPLAADMALRLEALPSHRLAQLRALYDGAPVGLAFLDRGLRYVSLNRKLADMHRLPVEAHLGRTLPEVLPELFPQLEPHVRRALGGEPVADLEISRSWPGHAEEQRFRVSYLPVCDEAGEILGITATVADITGG